MPNIVNPAVAVAAQGGGKFIHNITVSDIVQANCLYICERETPFTSLRDFYNELVSKGYTSRKATYPVSGWLSNSSDERGEIFSVYASGASLLFGYGNADGKSFFEVETSLDFYYISDTIL